MKLLFVAILCLIAAASGLTLSARAPPATLRRVGAAVRMEAAPTEEAPKEEAVKPKPAPAPKPSGPDFSKMDDPWGKRTVAATHDNSR